MKKVSKKDLKLKAFLKSVLLPKEYKAKVVKDSDYGYKLKIEGKGFDLQLTEGGCNSWDLDGSWDGHYLGTYGCDSFQYYNKKEFTVQKMLDDMEAEVTRIKRYATYPHLKFGESSWRVPPERLEQLRATLKKGKVDSFYPSGFGTGCHISLKPTGSYTERLRDKQTLKHLAVGDYVYYDTFDWD